MSYVHSSNIHRSFMDDPGILTISQRNYYIIPPDLNYYITPPNLNLTNHHLVNSENQPTITNYHPINSQNQPGYALDHDFNISSRDIPCSTNCDNLPSDPKISETHEVNISSRDIPSSTCCDNSPKNELHMSVIGTLCSTICILGFLIWVLK